MANKQIKRMENVWVLPEKQNQIAVVGRTCTSPPLINTLCFTDEPKYGECSLSHNLFVADPAMPPFWDLGFV